MLDKFEKLRKNTTLVYICGQPQFFTEGVRVLNYCNKKIKFDNIVMLSCVDSLSDSLLQEHNIKVVKIPKLSYKDFNIVCLSGLLSSVSTDYCLVVHGDGFIINEDNWDDKFFNYDFLGSPLAYHGNPILCGGFSLRSRKLLAFLHKFNLLQAGRKQPEGAAEQVFMDHLKNEEVIAEDSFIAQMLSPDFKQPKKLYDPNIAKDFNYCDSHEERKSVALRFSMDDSIAGGGANPDDYYDDLFGINPLCRCGSRHSEIRTEEEIIDKCFGFHHKSGKLNSLVNDWYSLLHLKDIIGQISRKDIGKSLGLFSTYIGSHDYKKMGGEAFSTPVEEKVNIQGKIQVSQHPAEYIPFIEDLRNMKDVSRCLFFQDYENQTFQNNILSIVVQALALSFLNKELHLDVIIENYPMPYKSAIAYNDLEEATILYKGLSDMGISVNIIKEKSSCEFLRERSCEYDYISLSYGNSNSVLLPYHIDSCKELLTDNGIISVHNIDNNNMEKFWLEKGGYAYNSNAGGGIGLLKNEQ